MNILFLTTKFPLASESPYLTNDLVLGLSKEGHIIDVLVIDWYRENPNRIVVKRPGVTVFSVHPARVSPFLNRAKRLIEWSLSGLLALRFYRSRRTSEQIEAVIAHTPLIVFFPVLEAICGTTKAQRISLVWDFFPDHQIYLGLVPAWIGSALKRIEVLLYRRSTRICVLNEDYQEYLHRNFVGISRDVVRVSGLWVGASEATETRVSKRATPNERKRNLVYGGQIIAGRGVSNFLEIARICRRIDESLMILVYSWGKKVETLRRLLHEHALWNVEFRAPVSRPDYIDELRMNTIGLVSLDSNVACPSFPSKIVDYVRAGLDILVITDSNPALARFLRVSSLGDCIASEDHERIAEFISKCTSKSRKGTSYDSRLMTQELFSTEKAVRVILGTEST